MNRFYLNFLLISECVVNYFNPSRCLYLTPKVVLWRSLVILTLMAILGNPESATLFLFSRKVFQAVELLVRIVRTSFKRGF